MYKLLLPFLGLAAIIGGSVMLSAPGWASPIDNAGKRPLLLTYGLYVTPDPEQNPIDPPERFTGFHAALDVEIMPGEEEIDVPVYAACDGEVLMATWAEGYGGVIIHRCVLDNEEVTVLYGHVDPDSMTIKVGDVVTKGKQIAVLAPAHTLASDGNRKHLHFGIHRGADIVTLGYVQTEKELENFLDPQKVLGL